MTGRHTENRIATFIIGRDRFAHSSNVFQPLASGDTWRKSKFSTVNSVSSGSDITKLIFLSDAFTSDAHTSFTLLTLDISTTLIRTFIGKETLLVVSSEYTGT